MSRDDSRDTPRDVERDAALVAAHERLVDALIADLLDAAEGEVLASHTPAAARVAADKLRQRLRRATAGRAGEAAPEVPPGSPRPARHRPGEKP